MANRTAKHALDVHGTNPQHLIEKMTREKIRQSIYWRESCTALNSALVLEKAVDDLTLIGGLYGGQVKPTPFICLVLKLLQIQPIKEIIHLYIEQSDFKYLRALGVFYLRMVGTPYEVYKTLEPIYKDYRKLRVLDRNQKLKVVHMDEFIDDLLHQDRVLDLVLPRLTKRQTVQETTDLGPYTSVLDELGLVPEQLIKEKQELKNKKRKHDDDEHRNSRHETSHQSDRHDHKSIDRHRSSHSDRYSSRHRYDKRHRSRSPVHRNDTGRHPERQSGSREHKISRQSNRPDKIPKHCKFSQAEIDRENSIRTKVGLGPLKY